MSENVRSIPPFGLRMPPAVKSSVEMEARKNERSMNAEIVHQLKRVYGLTETEKAEARS